MAVLYKYIVNEDGEDSISKMKVTIFGKCSTCKCVFTSFLWQSLKMYLAHRSLGLASFLWPNLTQRRSKPWHALQSMRKQGNSRAFIADVKNVD